MKKKITTFKNADELGRALGLSEVDMFIAKQKISLIKIIKQKRIEKKITQADFAKAIKSSQTSVARMESGAIGNVSIEFLIRAAHALNAPIKISSTRNKKKKAA